MLHMLVATHGPDTCPAANASYKKAALEMGPRMPEVSQKHGCSIQGGWVSRSAHSVYVLIDAPNAHAIDDLAMDLELAHWNTVAINPVTTMEEAMQWLAEAG